MTDTPTPAWIRPLCLGSFVILIILQTLSAIHAVQNEGAAAYLVFGIKVLPLLLFIPSLWKNQKRAYAWLGFILCLFFLEPVVDFVAGQQPWLNGLLIANLILLFSASILFIRRYTETKVA